MWLKSNAEIALDLLDGPAGQLADANRHGAAELLRVVANFADDWRNDIELAAQGGVVLQVHCVNDFVDELGLGQWHVVVLVLLLSGIGCLNSIL